MSHHKIDKTLDQNTTEVNSKWLFFPMEIVERELYGNILLGLEAVHNGWNFILGTKKSIYDHVNDLPQGTGFLKSITAPDIVNMQKLQDAGHHVVCLDVEGLVYTSLDEFISVRFSKETIENVEHLYFWGHLQRDAVAGAFPDAADKMFTTGSPIADFWQREELHRFYQEDVDKLKEKYGPYILIPSSFGTANHHMGREATREIMMRDKMLKEEEREEFFEFWLGYEDHVYGIFEKFLDILPKVSKAFPDHKIIVRPHPSESHESWLQIAKDLPNVIVVFEGVVAPWLLAADAILHWGCTTAIEGYLMGKPVVSYNPVSKEAAEKYDHTVPHYISIMTETEQETVNALRRVIDDPEDLLEQHPEIAQGEEKLREWIIDTRETASTKAIVAHLESLNTESASLQPIPKQKIPFKERVWAALDLLTRHPKGLQGILPERLQIGIKSRAYGRHKTRDINEATMRDAVERLAAIRGIKGIKIEKLATNLFRIGT